MFSGFKLAIGVETIYKAYGYVEGVFIPTKFNPRKDVFFKLGDFHSVGKPNKTASNFEHNSVFGLLNFPAVYRVLDSSKPINKKKLSENVKVLDGFFHNALCEFDYIYTTTKDINEDGELKVHESKLPEEVVNELIYQLILTNKPQTVVVDGQIGCGKSTFLAAIMRELVSSSKSSKYFPIKLDLREDLKQVLEGVISGKYESENEISSALNESFNHVLGLKLKEAGFDITKSKPLDKKLTSIYLKDKSPIIIIDELDFIYYDFCCAAFDPFSGVTKDQLNDRYLRITNYFFSLAANECFGGHYGNNTIVIVAARTSTLKLLDDIRENSLHKPHSNGQKICHKITINSFNNLQINNIIKKRLEYSIKVAKHSKSSRAQKYISNLSEAKASLDKNTPKFERNLILSVHGLRHLMKILSKAEEYDPSGNLLSYYLRHPNLMRIYQYLDGCSEYSQTLEGVSNIFLVNRDFRISQSKFNKPSSIAEQNSLFSDHLQTYWLKYLLMKLIKCMTDKGKTCTTNDVINVFCHSDASQSWQHYEKEILYLIILHATEVIHGRLIKLSSDQSKTDTGLILSSRAQEFLNKDLFWEFSYLFVIIEDEWLTLPKSTYKDFIIDEQWKRTYHFITQFPTMSNEDKYKFIKYKSILVLKFCAVLHQALIEERKRNELVFYRLSSLYGLNIKPNKYIKDMRAILIDSICKFTKSYVSDSAEDEIKKDINKFMKKGYKKYRNKIEKDYEKYNAVNITFTSMAEKMKKYHTNRKTTQYNVFDN